MDNKRNPKVVISALLLCLFLKSYFFSLADDTIRANQSLSGDQTIVSAGGVFELGFFKPGNVSNYYIGMWYSEQLVSARIVVWVANRENPISDRFASVLRIADGNLVLYNELKAPVWSTNLTSATTSGSLQALLLDSGNLVLLRAGSGEPSWQSFDHPAHTWLPGGKIGFNSVTKQAQILTSWKSSEDPSPGLFSLELSSLETINGSNAYSLRWNGSKEYWTSGVWDETFRFFSQIPEMRISYTLNFSYVTSKNGNYFTYSLYSPGEISAIVMNTTGQIQHQWWDTSKQWKSMWSQPLQECEIYAFCGAFGNCNQKKIPSCNCLSGFEPASQREWDLHSNYGGCSRKTSLHCGSTTNGMQDRFLEMTNMLFPENEVSMWGDLSTSQCESICLNNCSCTAYAYGSGRCSIWTGDLMNLQQLAAGDANETILYIRVAGSELKHLESKKHSLVIALVSATSALLMLVSIFFSSQKILRKKRETRRKAIETAKNYAAASGKNDTELPLFSLKSILAATNNFSEVNKLGEGGFGPVYKGILQENQEVALKRLSKKSGQGHQEFMNELNLIAKLQHTNLVRLVGCCNEKDEMILIYEFMPNGSLDILLFDPHEKTELDWGKRFRIVEGIAQGVLYIHKYSRLKIIHRDLKASNVLLDASMNPRISDFGMARILEINQTEANTKRVVGTYGYMSPEYARYGHFSEKLDVFSFGVLLLEIVSGKKNAAFYGFEHSPTLAGWAWELWKEGRGMEVIDASVRETCLPDEALRCIYVGFLCVQEDPADRPTMSTIILMLQGNEAPSLPPSKAPAFSTHRDPSVSGSSPSQTPASFSNNAVTISLPEGR